MFCPNCGRSNEESDNFCRYCGKRLPDEGRPAATAESGFRAEADFSVEPIADPAAERVGAGNSAFYPTNLLKSIFTSPSALVALIATTATACYNLFNLFRLFSVNYIFFYETLDGMGDEGMAAVASAITSLLFLVPQILLVVGSWITYSSAANRQTWEIKTSGLTLVRAALIAELVVGCVVFGLLEVALLISLAVLSAETYPSYSVPDFAEASAAFISIVIGILFVIIAAALVIGIIYFVKAYRMVEVMRNTLTTGVPSDHISVYVMVMSFIQAGFTIITALRAPVVPSLLGGICSATANISFGVFLYGYRAKMRALKADAPIV